MFWNREPNAVFKGLAAGAIGGALASFVMNQFQAGMSKLMEPPQTPSPKKKRARQAQGWKEHRQPRGPEEENATIKAAVAVSDQVFDHELKEEEKQTAGNAMHYAFGIVSGALYGALAEESEMVKAAQGLAFGTALWLLADEVAVPGLGLSRRPTEYPAKTHVMALGSHLVYGLTTEITRRALRSGPLGRSRW